MILCRAGARRADGGKAESAHTPVCTISLTVSVTGLRFITMDIRAGTYKPAINSDVSTTKPKQERISMLTDWTNGEWHELCYNNKESFNRKGNEMSETETKQRLFQYVVLKNEGAKILNHGPILAIDENEARFKLGQKYHDGEGLEVHIRPF